MTTCPNGHQSASSDYCDTCGVPIPEGSESGSGQPAAEAEETGTRPGMPAAPEVPQPQKCPNCAS